MSAFIEALQSQKITLSSGGLVKSSNYEEGVSGFKITHDGGVEFNNGVFRGDIFANDGYFKGIIEAKTGLAGAWSYSPAMPSYMHVRAFGRFTVSRTHIGEWGHSSNYVGSEVLDNRTWLVKFNSDSPQLGGNNPANMMCFTYGFWRKSDDSFDNGRITRCIDTAPGAGGWKIHLMTESGIYTPEVGESVAVMFFAVL